jgi:hypothetical protein
VATNAGHAGDSVAESSYPSAAAGRRPSWNRRDLRGGDHRLTTTYNAGFAGYGMVLTSLNAGWPMAC